MSRCLPLLLSLMVGCTINNDRYPRPRDLSPAWRVDKLRLLATRAEPPEIRPGETASLEALLIDPEASVGITVWVACSEEQATGFGCPFDPGLFGDEEPTIEELVEAGVIGVEPQFPPSYTADLGLLDELPAEERLEGLNITISTLALPSELADTDAFDFNEVEAGFKRLVVSEAPTPNHNPTILRFTVDGVVVPEGGVAIVDPGQPYELEPVLADDAVETYTFVNRDGEAEERVEEPFASWFATGGTVDEDVTLHPFLPSTWIAPEQAGEEGTFWAVVKDRRGGISWVERRWRTRSP